MKKDIFIVDTTLRDGEQSPGKVFTQNDKLCIAKSLEEKGVYQIEAGIPAMGEDEKETIKRIINNKKNILISTWNRMNKSDIIHSIECNPDIIHISAPTSDMQIEYKLNKDRKWVEEKLLASVYFAKNKGFEVTVGFEDGSRSDINYLIKLCERLKALEVKTVRYADTVGILTPSKVSNVIKKLITATGIDVEIHVHNDFGMALANSIEAVKAGSKYVDCTIDGIGERAGNCDLDKFMHVLKDMNKLFTNNGK